MTFDPLSVEVTCVTLPKDHCVQVPWQYINVCGYSDEFCKLPHTYAYYIHTYYVYTTYRMSDHIVFYWTQFRQDKNWFSCVMLKNTRKSSLAGMLKCHHFHVLITKRFSIHKYLALDKAHIKGIVYMYINWIKILSGSQSSLKHFPNLLLDFPLLVYKPGMVY